MKTMWQDKRVLIIGAARQGLAAARYLCTRGARVTLNDNRSASELRQEIEKLSGFNIEWKTGGHPLKLIDGKDYVIVSGGVPLSLPLIRNAREQSIPLTNDSEIFMQAVKCPVVGITGSAGKSTTTALLGEIARAAFRGGKKVWVGGNIGIPLIEYVDEIQPEDWVILELSSFQLDLMTSSPHIAAVTNITPNHLDRHGTLEAYTAAKARILLFQSSADIAILNCQDEGAWNLRGQVKGKLSRFGCSEPGPQENGAWAENGKIYLKRNQESLEVCSYADIKLRGEHNILNVLAACSIADEMGISPAVMRETIRNFSGLPHRLEYVRELGGIRWINDSIATAPERSIAAINSFDEPLILMLGGKDKDLPWERLAELVSQKVNHVIIFGAAASKINAAISEGSSGARPYSVTLCNDLEQAVRAAHLIAKAGDVVLFSPGATSYDAFKDFEERGEKFRLWVHQLA